MKIKFKYIFFSLLILCVLCSCRDMIKVETPQNQLTTDKVFSDTVSATAALLNVYDVLQNKAIYSANRFLSAYADESLSSTSSYQPWNQSRVPPSDASNLAIWSNYYSVIYQCNTILEQCDLTNKLPETFIKRTEGEAKFLRAFSYLQLINLFGHIPLLTSSDVNVNRVMVQSDSAQVYDFIKSDLLAARTVLGAGYLTSAKVRANKYCAAALLARIYCYQHNWSSAEDMANEVISSGLYTPLDAPANVFQASGKESILQLATPTGFVTEGSSVIPSSATTIPTFYFTSNFYQSFEAGDLRKSKWIGSNTITASGISTVYYYPSKYKNRAANTTAPENLVVLRAGEQYLIRAESRFRQNKVNGPGSGEEDLNMIRTRAGLSAVHFTDASTALVALSNEHWHELFFENCDRFMDLKQSGRLQSVMSANKSTWASTGNLLPIPTSEILTNSNIKQNDGY